jgi:hypothetical protein
MGGGFDRWWTRKDIRRRRGEEEGVRHAGPWRQWHVGRGRRRAHASWASGARWARPKAGRGERKDGPRAEERRVSGGLPAALGWAESEKRNENPFLFLFTTFQSIFKWIFEILFEFSNRAHNTKYYAAVWMLKHVLTLIFDFKLIKIIIILSLYAHKNT